MVPSRSDGSPPPKLGRVGRSTSASGSLMSSSPSMANTSNSSFSTGRGSSRPRYYAKKRPFNQVAARIAGDAKTWLKGDLASGFYELVIKKIEGGRGTYWEAEAKSAGKVPASLREAIKAEFPSV
jgi:hypothetical protein